MSNREDLLNWFIRGTFLAKPFPDSSNNPYCEKCRLSINDERDILLAVKKAYIDMVPRTFKSKNKNKKEEIDQTIRDEILSQLAHKIFEYVQSRKYDKFDIWHKKLCNDFKDNFNEHVLEPANRIEAKDGKAQKIVNMTFKYLYCFDDAEDYINLFEKCHMAIDSYIIEWYNKIIESKEDKITDSWSNLDYGDIENPKQKTYFAMQKNIRKYIAKNKYYGENPFYAEFIIWQEEKAKAVNK